MADPRVKQRAEQLVKGGMTAGKAARQAYDEIYGVAQKPDTFIDEVVLGTPYNVIASQKKTEEDLSTDIKKTQLSIEQQKQDFVRRRSSELQTMGFSEAEAIAEANRQFNTNVEQPVAKGFGTREEKRKASEVGVSLPLVGSIGLPIVDVYSPENEPLNLTANKPSKLQEAVASLQPRTYGTEDEKPSADVTSATINWDKVRQSLKEASPGMTDENLDITLDSIRRGWDRAYLRQLQSGKRGLEASEAALNSVIEAYVGLAEGVATTDLGEASKAAPTTEMDIFKPTYKPGEGIPDITDEQRQLISDSIDISRTRKIAQIKREKPNKIVYVLQNGKEVDKGSWTEEMGPVKSQKTVAKSEDEIRKEAEASIPKLWWQDPAQYSEIIKDPSKFQSYGILSAPTPGGGEKETTLGVLLKGAMAIPNITAGVGSVLAYEVIPEMLGDEGALAAKRAKERASNAPIFEDNPILYNIYNNMGFFGEADQATRVLNIEGVPKYVTLAGAFAADMLDPTFDALHGLGAGARAGYGLKTAGKTAGLERGTKDILSYGTKVGISTLAENSGAARLFIPNGMVGQPGDIRNIVAMDAAREMKAADVATSGAKDGKTIVAIKSELAEKGLENTQFSKALERGQGDDIAAIVEAAKGDTKLGSIGAYNDVEAASKAIDDSLAGRPVGAANKDVAKALGAVAARDANVKAAMEAAETKTVSGYLQSLDSKGVEAVKDEMISSAAKNAIYKITRDQLVPDSMVAVTKNTFANKDTANIILEETSKTPIGQIASDLKGGTITYRKVEIPEVIPPQPIPKVGEVPFKDAEIPRVPSKTVQAAFDLNGPQVDALKNTVNNLKSTGAITSAEAKAIEKNLNIGAITPKDVRRLLDAQVDEIARGKFAGTSKTSEQLALLPTSRQQDFLVPTDSRGFVKDSMKRVWERVKGYTGRESSSLTIGQQKLLREAQKEISTMDTRLGNDINRLLNDEAYRTAVTGSPAPIDRQTALAYAIVGPKTEMEAGNVAPAIAADKTKNVIETVINSMFYRKENRQDVFDFFTGLSIRYSSPLSLEGRIALYGAGDADLTAAAARVVENPETLWSEINKLADKMQKEILTKNEYLKSGEGNIINIYGEKKVIPVEAQIAGFYSSKARDVEQNLVTQLVNDNLGQADINIFNYMTDKERDVVEGVLFGSGQEDVNVKIKNYNNVIGNVVEGKLSQKVLTDKERAGLKTLTAEEVKDAKVEAIFDNLYHGSGVQKGKEAIALQEERIKAFEGKTDKEIADIRTNAKDKLAALQERAAKNKRDIEISYDNKMYQSESRIAELKRKLNINVDIKNKQDIAQYIAKKEELAKKLQAAMDAEKDIINDTSRYLEMKSEVERARTSAQTSISKREAAAERKIAKAEERLKAKEEKLKPALKERIAKGETTAAAREEAIKQKAEQRISRREGDIQAAYETDYELSKKAFINKYNSDSEFRNAINKMMANADAIADGIIQKNGLSSVTSVNETIDAAEKISTALNDAAMYDQLRLIAGDEAAAQIKDAFNKTYTETTQNLNDVIRMEDKNKDLLEKSADFIRGPLADAIQNFKYLGLLTFRPRFHGANLMSASDIIYSTTGKLPKPSYILEAADIMTEPWYIKAGSDDTKIIFTDKAGRPWTKGELREILEYKSGSTSQGFATADISGPRAQVTGAKGGRTLAAMKELAQTEDLLFRYNAFRSAIDEGRSEAEAIEIARRSMYDAADVTDVERTINKNIMFYNWARNNAVNAADNMTRIQGLKRISKVARTKNAVERTVMEDKQIDLAPQHMETRIILNSLPWSEDRDKVIATAPSSTLDGVSMVATLMKGEGADVFSKMASPELKILLNIQTGMEKEFEYIPPEHIAYFKFVSKTLNIPVETLIEAITGGKVAIEFKPQTDKGVTVEGQSGPVAYRLLDDKQKEAYKRWYNLWSFAGATTLAQDYAKMFGATEGTPSYGRGWGEAIATSLGLATPSSNYISRKQALFRLKAQKAEADKLVQAMQEVEGSRYAEQARLAPASESKAGQDINEIRKEAASARTELKSQYNSSLEVAAEMKKVFRAIAPYDIMTEDDRAAKLKELQAEYIRLQNIEEAMKPKAPAGESSGRQVRSVSPRNVAPRTASPRTASPRKPR